MQKNVSVLRFVLLIPLMLCVAEAFSTLATPAVFAASQPSVTSWVDSDFVRILAKSPLPAQKIAEGIYWVGGSDESVEVKGRKYRYYDAGGTGKWKPVSELTYIRKGVFRLDRTYWCLSTMPRNPNNNVGSCTASGW
jgi:hypothetical protein